MRKNVIEFLKISLVFLIILFNGFSKAWADGTTHKILGHHTPKISQAPYVGEVDNHRRFHLAVSLPLRNKSELNQLLKDLYDRKSPSYHRFLKPDQFTAQYGPTAEDAQAVADYFSARGFVVTKIHSNRVIVDVEGNNDAIQKAFHVRLHNYQRPDGSTFYAPDDDPSVDLDTPIADISGIENFVLPEPVAQSFARPGRKPSGLATGGWNAPIDLRNAYAGNVANTGSGQSVALFELSTYVTSDVAPFQAAAGTINAQSAALYASFGPVQNIYLDSLTDGSNNNAPQEVALDIDCVESIAPGAAINVYMGTDSDDVLNQIAEDDSCNQVSASWEYSTTGAAFSQFAAQGQSYFNASGDWFSYDSTGNSFDPNSYAGYSLNYDYVTIVGGTELTTTGNPSVYSSEIAWNQGNAATGGGILTLVPIPLYQQGLNVGPAGGSTTNRNAPDVSACAYGIWIYEQGSFSAWGGTSAATPLWAGYTALVNQQALQAGAPLTGFINPVVYSIGENPTRYAADFHDITSGTNTGYNAVTGYDLVTGWGSPTGQSLINDLLGFRPTPTPTQVNCAGLPTWTSTGMPLYQAGTQVVYQGSIYKALVTTYGLAVYTPGSTPTVWQLIGTCGAPPTNTPTVTFTSTKTSTTTNTSTPTPTFTLTPTPTATFTSTGTILTSTPTRTPTSTPTFCSSNYLNWTVQNPMPVVRYGVGAAVLNGTLYAAGGENNSGAVNNLEAYNPATNSWSELAPVPTTRYRLGAGVVNGILYAIGGNNGTTYNTVEAYNPATNTWATMAPMPTARAAVGVAVINGILYAVGGEYIGGSLTNLEAYNPATNAWTELAPMPASSAGMAVGVMNGILYAAGGISTTGQGYSPLSNLQAYNPATNTWTTLPAMPTARGFCSGGVVNGQLYVAGGETNLALTGVLSTVESYNPSTNSWTTQASLPTAVNGSASGVLNGNLYVVGGSDINNNPTALNQEGALVCGLSPTPTTAAETNTVTSTPTKTPIGTATPTATATNTPTLSATASPTQTGTATSVYTATFTNTVTPRATFTPSSTATRTNTPTFTWTPTITPTFTFTPTPNTGGFTVAISGVSPSCGAPGTSVAVTVTWSGNSSYGTLDAVLGFGVSPIASCGTAWTGAESCSGSSILNPSNIGSSPSGTYVWHTTVPTGAASGYILLGTQLNCGSVGTGTTGNCGTDYWTNSRFSTTCSGAHASSVRKGK